MSTVSLNLSQLVASEWAHAPRPNDKTLTSQRFLGAAFKKFLALVDQRRSSEVLDVYDNNAGTSCKVEILGVSESFVGSEKNVAVLPRIFENPGVGSRSESDVARVNKSNVRQASQSVAYVAVDALIRENREHGNSSVRDASENLGGALKNAGGEFDGGIDVLFGNTLVLSGNLVDGVASAKKIQNIDNGNARPADCGLAETNVVIDADTLIHNEISISPDGMKKQWSMMVEFVKALLVPNRFKFSALLKFKIFRPYLRYTNELEEKLAYKKKRPHEDGTS